MKNTSVIVTKIGGVENLQLVDTDIPSPQRGQVRIAVRAIGVSQADITIRRGMYPKFFKPPFTIGYDLVGVVDKVGDGVEQFQIGDLVAAITVIGAYTKYICWEADDLILVPSGLEPSLAVCLILNYVTAYQMLYRTAKAQKGETVLIHSGAGGVGTALIQLGKLLELKMLATASTSKLELVKNLGAIPIDYTKEDFTQRVRELVPEGIDAVFDAIGGSSFTRSFNCLKPKGRFIGYGFTSKMNSPFWGRLDTFTRFGLMKLFPRGREATFYGIMFVKAAHPDWFKEDLTHLFNLLEQGKIDPIVNSVFPLEQARQAHELMESRQVMGKIVLIVNN